MNAGTVMTRLAGVPFFAGLEVEDLERLAKRALSQRFEPEQGIFAQGDPGDALYLIESGAVRITFTHAAGQRTILVLLGPGDLFGELSVFDGRPRSATASAASPTQVLRILKDDFLEFIEEQPKAAVAVLKVLSQRLRRSDELIGDASFLDVATRLSKKLVELADSMGRQEDGGTVIPLRRGFREVGEMVGIDGDMARRWLTRFQQRGLIKMERDRIILLRPADLREGSLEPDTWQETVPFTVQPA